MGLEGLSESFLGILNWGLGWPVGDISPPTKVESEVVTVDLPAISVASRKTPLA